MSGLSGNNETIENAEQKKQRLSLEDIKKSPWTSFALVSLAIFFMVCVLSSFAGKSIMENVLGWLALGCVVVFLATKFVRGSTDLRAVEKITMIGAGIAILLFFIRINSPGFSYVSFTADKPQPKATTQQRQIKSVDDLNFSTVEVGEKWVEIARINGECKFYYSSPEGFFVKDQYDNVFYHNPCKPEEVRSFRFTETQPGTIIYIAKPKKASGFNLQYQII